MGDQIAVRVRFMGPYCSLAEEETIFKVPCGTTARQLLLDVFQKYPQMKRYHPTAMTDEAVRSQMLLHVKDSMIKMEYILGQGDTVSIWPPIGGG